MELSNELLRDVAKLSFSSAATYPILFFVIYTCTSVDFSTLALCGFFAVVPAGIARVHAARVILAARNPSEGQLQLWTRLSVLAAIVGWSLFAGATIVAQGAHSWDTNLLILSSTGIAAGGSLSLAGDMMLGRTFLFTIWIAHTGAFVIENDYPMAFVVTMFCFYLALQHKRQHLRLTRSVLDRFALAGRADELDLANRKLSQAQIRAEEMLLLAEQQRSAAEEANLAKSRFLATISHEIRTPLHGVLGANSLLAVTELGEEQREYVETIRQSGEALLDLINDVLDFSKLEAGREEAREHDFRLGELLEQSLEIVQHKALEKSLSLDFTLQEDLPSHLRGDAGHLRQILLNLLSNAVKFTDHGGVRLDVRRYRTEPEREWLEFRVADTGIGIAHHQQTILFEPFQQLNSSTTRTRGGTGLGLAISQRLTELLEGTLEVESQEGEGSTFYLRLPFGHCEERESAPLQAGSGRRERLEKRGEGLILVAEDNPTNQKIIERLLSKAGYRCDVVGNGRLAIEAARNHEFALILMDCHMPELDGYEATERIHEILGESCPPIVAVTANASEEDRQKCREAGMVDFLTKPLKLDRLQEVLDRYLS
mgnify:CR=1 FL=1